MASKKRTRNPGWDPGNHWVTCEVSGEVLRVKDAEIRWDGKVVQPEDNEVRHPQELYRPHRRQGEGDADGVVRTDPEPEFVEVTYAGEKEEIPDGNFEDNNGNL